MNVTEEQAKTILCPILNAMCLGTGCMLWQFDEAMFNGPDSYISDPPPTGHCGMVKQDEVMR